MSYATVGGGQTINVLGYEPIDEKVYLLRNDERGLMPQLYYYDLKKSSPTLVEVKSIYNQSSHDDYETRDDKIIQEIEKIQTRLQPLSATSTKNFQITIQDLQIKQVPQLYNEDNIIFQYKFQYTVHNQQ